MPVQWSCPKCESSIIGVYKCWTCGYERPRGIYVTTWSEE